METPHLIDKAKIIPAAMVILGFVSFVGGIVKNIEVIANLGLGMGVAGIGLYIALYILGAIVKKRK
ncbi:MAG: hypothetical protein OEL83_17425 [Desulforhopalus sp.]|nr:hypothetical protein [Desulforhopalus sp.]